MDGDMAASHKGDADSEFSGSDNSMCFKAMGILMSQIVNKKRMELSTHHDTDFSKHQNNSQRKTTPYKDDLTIIMRSIIPGGEFSSSDNTLFGKTPVTSGDITPEHTARLSAKNHIEPICLHNAEIIYKSLKPGGDMRKIKNEIISDTKSPVVQETLTKTGKTRGCEFISGSKTKDLFHAEVTGESTKTFNYKRAKMYDNKRVGDSLVDGLDESDITKNRRPNHQNYNITNKEDLITTIEFSDNSLKNRHGGRLGSKYTQHLIDRDNKMSDEFGK